jgi:hypothetical protein
VTDLGITITTPATHADGVQITAGNNITIRRNNFEMPWDDPTWMNHQVVMCKTDSGTIDNVLIKENRINGGGYSIHISEQNHGAPTNAQLINNVFGTDYEYAPWTTDGNPTISGNTWESDGSLIAGQN